MSRSVWLRDEAAREDFHNDGTVCLPALAEPGCRPAAAPPSFEQAFRRHYESFRLLLERHAARGLALAVVSSEGLEATAWVPAEADGINPVIVGRHSTAEVFLPSDAELSLRHLAVIVQRADAGAPRFRVLDLRSSGAFEDEEGHRLEALESAGPTMVRCASYALLLFPTLGGGTPWPADPEAGWRRVPGRVYLDSKSADPERWQRGDGLAVRFESGPGCRADETSSIVSFPGPAFFSRATEQAGPALGEIRVRSWTGSASLVLHREAARRGVLLGRYERCDGAGLPCLSSDSLSRVHLLVVESGGGLWAIDTASKNGTWLGGERIRRARLVPGQRLTLARDIAVEWRPYH